MRRGVLVSGITRAGADRTLAAFNEGPNSRSGGRNAKGAARPLAALTAFRNAAPDQLGNESFGQLTRQRVLGYEIRERAAEALDTVAIAVLDHFRKATERRECFSGLPAP